MKPRSMVCALAVAAALVALVDEASANCETYTLARSPKCGGIGASMPADLKARGLHASERPDVALSVECVHAEKYRDMGGLHVPYAYTGVTVTMKTRHAVVANAELDAWKTSLDQLLEENRGMISIVPAESSNYVVVEPSEDSGTYSEPMDLRCLPSRARVTIQTGEFSYHAEDARGGRLTVSPIRQVYRRVQSKVRPWPQGLEVTLCLGLSPSDCAPIGSDADNPDPRPDVLASPVRSRHLKPNVSLAGMPDVELPEEGAALAQGSPWSKTWRLKTDMAKEVNLRVTVDGDSVPIHADTQLPFWAVFVCLLPERAQKIFIENYPTCVWFGIAMIVLGIALPSVWARRGDWLPLLRGLRAKPPPSTTPR